MLLCCEGIFFFIGLSLVMSGGITINNRRLDGQRVRMAGWVLMSPPIIAVIFAFIISPQFIANPTDNYEEMVIAMLPLTFLELVILIAAISLAGWLLAQAAKESPGEETDPLMKEMVEMLHLKTAQPVRKPDTFSNIMTVAEAAAYLRVSEDEVLELINTSQLAAARIGDQYRIARRAIDDYLTRDSDA